MASTTMAWLPLLLLVAGGGMVMSAHAAAVTPAPAPDCSSVLTGLIDCLGYVQAGGAESKPSKNCCTGVKSAVKDPAAVACLCAAFGQSLGIKVNMTRAAGLPAACGASASAFSKCHINVPGAPTEAPSPSAGAPIPGGPGSSTHSAATRPPVTASILAATAAVPLLAYYFL